MRKLIALAALAAVAVMWPGGLSARDQGSNKAEATLESVLTKSSDYLKDYRDKLTYVMATEKSKQTLIGGFAGSNGTEETLASDVYFVYIPADKVWMAVRDVEVVDGETLKNRDNVRELLSSGQLGAARALKDRNARYNLGTILRNFCEPTLSLLVLDYQHRGRFNFQRQGTRGSTMTVSFVERDQPTLIIDTGGRPSYSSGEFAIDIATGRIERAKLQVKLSGGIDASLTTTYRLDNKLQMWVPAKFDEQYALAGRKAEKITATSTYSDFSRFDVSVRIK